jgi:hypothetical protein
LNRKLNALADYEVAAASQANNGGLEEYIPFHNLHYIKIIGIILAFLG